MLMNSFYTVTEQAEALDDASVGPGIRGKKTRFIVRLDPDDPVYGGHFPGNPVVPGVCQVQMIIELSSFVLKKNMVLSHSDNIKFLSMIRPSEASVLTVSIDIREKDADCWNVTAMISREEQVFLKLKGILTPESI